MPTWEETKRAGQAAFTLAGNLYQDVHNGIGSAYQQILISGHLYPSNGRDSLTQQIAEDMYPEPEGEKIGLLGRQHTYEPVRDQEQDQDQGIEPER